MPDLLSPEETKMVLARVAELQTERDGSAGTSTDELVKVAGEAGLDASLVPRALQEVLGTRAKVEVEREGNTTIATCEVPRWLSQHDLRDLALRLGHEFGGAGQFQPYGDAWRWGKVGKGAEVSMLVRQVSAGTLLRLEVEGKPSLGHSVLAGLCMWVAAASVLKVVGTALTAGIGWLAFAAGAVGYYLWQRFLHSSRNEAAIREVLEASVGKLPLPPPSQSQASTANKGA